MRRGFLALVLAEEFERSIAPRGRAPFVGGLVEAAGRLAGRRWAPRSAARCGAVKHNVERLPSGGSTLGHCYFKLSNGRGWWLYLVIVVESQSAPCDLSQVTQIVVRDKKMCVFAKYGHRGNSGCENDLFLSIKSIN